MSSCASLVGGQRAAEVRLLSGREWQSFLPWQHPRTGHGALDRAAVVLHLRVSWAAQDGGSVARSGSDFNVQEAARRIR